MTTKPALIIEYNDPVEGFRGWLVRDTADHTLCAGGMRVQPGLTAGHLSAMARNMGLKMQVCGLQVDGAKCGIDYEPNAPGKRAAIRRFLKFIQPQIESFYSMGPDLNVEMTELEDIARELGIPSVKMAVARAQGWTIDYFLERLAVLDRTLSGWPVGRLRAGHGVAAAGLAVLDFMNIPHGRAKVAIQGFGSLSRSCAHDLHQAGCAIIALSDKEKCLIAPQGRDLDIPLLLQSAGTMLPDLQAARSALPQPPDSIIAVPCDLLILAAVENTITIDNASTVRARALVPGANLAVTAAAIPLLDRAGIVVLPDFLAGCGGSLSMEGLFGPDTHPGPEAVIRHVTAKMSALVHQVLALSVEAAITPTAAALQLCTRTVVKPGTRPYALPPPS